MKSIILCLLICAVSLSAQKKKESDKKEDIFEGLSKVQVEKVKAAIDDHTKDYIYMDKYVFQKKFEEFEKLRPSIEKKINYAKDKVAVATNENTKKYWQKKLEEEEKKLKIAKIWKLYRDYYILCRSSYKKDRANYIKGAKALFTLKDQYKKLTAEKMPDPETEFYTKYGDKLAKLKATQALKNK